MSMCVDLPFLNGSESYEIYIILWIPFPSIQLHTIVEYSSSSRIQ